MKTPKKVSIKVSPLVHSKLDFLKKISKTLSSKKQKVIIQSADTEELLALVEISLNILRNRVPLRKSHFKKLASQADQIRRLSRARTPSTARRILLENSSRLQNGRGIPAFAPILAGILIPIITDYLKSSQ